MWSRLPRPIPLDALQRETLAKGQGKLRLRYGPWRTEAGQRLRAAAIGGALPVYLVARATRRPAEGQPGELLRLSPNVIVRLNTSRGRLTDRPIHPTLKLAGGGPALLARLTAGYLVIRSQDLQAWLRAERRRGKWPSQDGKTGPRIGRPSKQNTGLRSAISAVVERQQWSAQHGIAKLHRLLVETDRPGVPSRDTIGRLVARMYRETGDPTLARKHRARRKAR
jgi:hypothetical protein